MELIEIANILSESGVLKVISLTKISETEYCFVDENGSPGTIDLKKEEVIIHPKNKIKNVQNQLH